MSKSDLFVKLMAKLKNDKAKIRDRDIVDMWDLEPVDVHKDFYPAYERFFNAAYEAGRKSITTKPKGGKP